MRKIRSTQILLFLAFFSVILLLGIGTTGLILGNLPLGDFRGVVLTAAGLVFTYLYALVVYRLFLYIRPLQLGEIPEGSENEFTYHVYLLFFLVFFYPVLRSGFVPVPLMRLVYLAMGAQLGENSYSSGIILDPIFVKVGDNTLIGQNALIIPHVVANNRVEHYPIKIGSNVTVGAHAIVLAGVSIGDNALISAGAVVRQNTCIGAGELWGGVPARCLRRPDEAGKQD